MINSTDKLVSKVAKLAQKKFSARVAAIDSSPGFDYYGCPSVFFRVVLRHRGTRPPAGFTWTTVKPIESYISRVFAKKDPTRFVYVRFESEKRVAKRK